MTLRRALAPGQLVELLGVPFDGMGRPGGQAKAPAALRAAGLRTLFPVELFADADVPVPPASQAQARRSGLLNETALLAMLSALRPRVASAIAAGRFPIVYGADCSVLLAAVPALREVTGLAGLVFADGHEDATPTDLSLTGEAANMEIALLLGLTDARLPVKLRDHLPALDFGGIAMLGQRDEPYRAELGVATLADRVWLRTADQVASTPARTAQEAVELVSGHAARWWLHTDLDVLARSEFSACGAPGELELAGGLTWSQLTELVSTALRAGGCCGWSVGVYNPELDPSHWAAARIVRLVADAFSVDA
jgi:arginase